MSWSSLRLVKKLPISAGGNVARLIVAEDAIYAANRYEDVVKLDRKTLREVWRRAAQKHTPRHVSAGLLLLGSMGRHVRVLRAETGEEVWARDTAFGAAPWQGRLLIPNQSAIEVADIATGQGIETIPVPDGFSGPPAFWGDLLIWNPEEGGDPQKAFSLTERRLLWERNFEAEMKADYGADEGNPVMVCRGSLPGRFLATRGGATFGCSLEDGRILWCARVPVPYRVPNAHDGRVYILWSARFIALNEATGEVLYEVRHAELEPSPTRNAAYLEKTGTIYGDTLAIPTESGHLPVFNLRDGSLAWFYFAKAPLWSTAEADGRLLVGTGDGKLLVFEDKG